MPTIAMQTLDDTRPVRLAPTAALCVACMLAFVWQTWQLTSGLEYWTLESRRQADAAQGRLSTSPMRLRDAAGTQSTAFSPSGAGDNVYLVDFIYTRCETVCRSLGSEFQQMQAALRASASASTSASRPPSVRLLSISIAPDEDSTAALAEYAGRYKAAAPLWTIAAPADAEESARHLRELGVVALPDGQGGYVHNGDIHLIDSRGRVRGIWSYEDWQQALAAAVRIPAPAGR